MRAEGESYAIYIVIAGTLQIVPTVLWLLMPLAERLDEKRKIMEEESIANKFEI